MILSSGLIPVFKTEDEYEFLLLRCFNYWDFPKGECDQGEDPEKAALRELQEETGITHVTFPWGKDFKETEIYSRQKVARYYIGLTKTKDVTLLPNPESGEMEHHEFRWVKASQAKVLLGERVNKILNWAVEKIH